LPEPIGKTRIDMAKLWIYFSFNSTQRCGNNWSLRPFYFETLLVVEILTKNSIRVSLLEYLYSNFFCTKRRTTTT